MPEPSRRDPDSVSAFCLWLSLESCRYSKLQKADLQWFTVTEIQPRQPWYQWKHWGSRGRQTQFLPVDFGRFNGSDTQTGNTSVVSLWQCDRHDIVCQHFGLIVAHCAFKKCVSQLFFCFNHSVKNWNWVQIPPRTETSVIWPAFLLSPPFPFSQSLPFFPPLRTEPKLRTKRKCRDCFWARGGGHQRTVPLRLSCKQAEDESRYSLTELRFAPNGDQEWRNGGLEGWRSREWTEVGAFVASWRRRWMLGSTFRTSLLSLHRTFLFSLISILHWIKLCYFENLLTSFFIYTCGSI